NEGVVTLSGECSDDNCKAAAEESAKSVEGVKEVINHISITPVPMSAPVEISADEPLRTAVNETVKTYKGVTATIDNGIITLEGNIKRDDLQKLMMKLNSLKPRKVENHLVIIK
ncbi:MAG: BON domain-containing protein, partial [Parafilimonas sp.]